MQDKLALHGARVFAMTLALLLLLAAATALPGQTSSMAANPGSVIVNGYAMSGVVTMPAAGATPVFDGAKGVCFVATLSAAVTSSTMANLVPGQLYTFEIIQGATPHAFVWPKNMYGVSAIKAQANYIVVELGVALSDGSVLGITSISATLNP